MRLSVMLAAIIALAAAPAMAAAPKGDAKKDDAKKAEHKAPNRCPDSITVEEQELDDDVDGWGSFADGDTKYTLDGVMVYAQKGRKKPLVKFEPSKGTESFSEWQLTDNGKVKYYLVCSYTHTSVLLKRELDKTLTACRVSYDPAAAPVMPRVMKMITCE